PLHRLTRPKASCTVDCKPDTPRLGVFLYAPSSSSSRVPDTAWSKTARNLDPVCRFRARAPMQLIPLFSAQEIKPSRPKANCFLNHREHQLHTRTEMGELWIEPLQIAVHRLPLKERVVDCNRVIIHPHAVEPH